jgi:hypothetical protein
MCLLEVFYKLYGTEKLLPEIWQKSCDNSVASKNNTRNNEKISKNFYAKKGTLDLNRKKLDDLS